MAAGLVKGEGFAVDASVMEANASRYHGKAPDEIVWAEPARQTRAVREYLAALEAENEPNPDRKPPKVISPSDPCCNVRILASAAGTPAQTGSKPPVDPSRSPTKAATFLTASTQFGPRLSYAGIEMGCGATRRYGDSDEVSACLLDGRRRIPLR